MSGGLGQFQYLAVNQLISVYPPDKDLSCNFEADCELGFFLSSWYHSLQQVQEKAVLILLRARHSKA